MKIIFGLIFGFGLIIQIGCGEVTDSGIDRADYKIYREYWFDKTIAETGATSVEVDISEFDFDILPPNYQSSHRFRITNVGETTLHLLAGPKTCKCTKIEIHDRAIDPGQSGEVEVFWKTIAGAREFKHSATVYTNDPTQKEVCFTVMGKVTRGLETQPGAFQFDRLDPDSESNTREVVVFSEEWENVDVGEFNSSFADESEFEVVDVTEAWKKKFPRTKTAKKIQMTLKTPQKPSLINGEVACKIKIPDRVVEHKIPVVGKVIRRLSVEETKEGTLTTDSVVHLGRVNSLEGKKVRFLLTVNDRDKSLGLGEVTCEPSFVNVELKPLNKKVDKHGVYVMDIIVPPNQESLNCNREGSFGKLKIVFDHERVSPLNLSLDFYVIK